MGAARDGFVGVFDSGLGGISVLRALVEELQNTNADRVILNAGAYSHYSIALRDCIECISVPVAEVHMTDISKREPFRRTDVLKDVCAGYFCGKGIESYMEAVRFFAK